MSQSTLPVTLSIASALGGRLGSGRLTIGVAILADSLVNVWFTVFFAVVFFAEATLLVGFFATVFFEAALAEATLVAVVFFAVAFFATVFFAEATLVAGFFVAVFFATGFFEAEVFLVFAIVFSLKIN